MKSRLLSVSSFFRLPLIAWNAPPAIISDMSGPTLLGLFGGAGDLGHAARRGCSSPPAPQPSRTAEQGLTVSEARSAAVARFMSG